MQVVAPVVHTPTTGERSNAGRLAYLDGFRALAALYVVFSHAYLNAIYGAFHISSTLVGPLKWLSYGWASVSVFIVLSGYSLMLPIAKIEGFKLRNGLWAYIRNRARRILPPYYATLCLTLLAAACFPILRTATGIWSGSVPIFEPCGILSHFLLIHNLNPDWAYRLNYPLWSVATEWQIYFFLPLVLLPVASRFGILVSVLFAFLIGYTPSLLGVTFLNSAAPWYVGLFALGMLTACVTHGNIDRTETIRKRVPWLLLAAVLLTMSMFLGTKSNLCPSNKRLLLDPLIGLPVCSFLLWLNIARENLAHHVLGSRALAALSGCSYSLYLTHAIVIALVSTACRMLPFSVDSQFLSSLVMGPLLSVLFANAFSRIFEKPFLNQSNLSRTA